MSEKAQELFKEAPIPASSQAAYDAIIKLTDTFC